MEIIANSMVYFLEKGKMGTCTSEHGVLSVVRHLTVVDFGARGTVHSSL